MASPNADRLIEHVEGDPQISSGQVDHPQAAKNVVSAVIASEPEEVDVNALQESNPAVIKTHDRAGRLVGMPRDQTSIDLPAEKPVQAEEQPRRFDDKHRYSGSFAGRDAAVQRAEYEIEMIIHIVRTERILLRKVDGKMVLPDHRLIRPEWHRHVPFHQIELERDQRLIHNELKAFVYHIGTDRYDANSNYEMFFEKVFAGQLEVLKALDERQQKVAAEREIAKKQSEFEKEMILHIFRTERILLTTVDGRIVPPDHKLIRPEWQRHLPYLVDQLERDQRLIRDELTAFVKHIASNQYDANCDYAKFFHKVFAGQPEVTNALYEKQLARQRAANASQTFQLS